MNEQLGNPPSSQAPEGHSGHGSHGWMMIVCCIPMLLIALALVITGVASPGLIVVAVGCTVMMAVMMRAMGNMGDEERDR